MTDTKLNEASGQTPDPVALLQLSFSQVPAHVLAAGVQLKVFTHIHEGASTAAEVAQAAGASERGTRMLLDALAVLQLLTKSEGRYALTPASAAYLVSDAPDYVGGIWESERWFENWLHLAEVVRTGQPVHRVEDQELAEQFFPALVRSLHVMNREPARRVAEILAGNSSGEPLRVLDVACGSGVWGIAFAEANPQTRVTAQDFPGLFATTREYVRRHNVEDRFDYLPGDLKEVDFGEAQYDVALLGNIVHSEGEASSRTLFRRISRALRPGGRCVVIDMVPDDARTGPPFPLFFALNMLLHTAHGDTYTLAEYTRWLNEAGFPRVETADIGSHSPLIIGYKE